jgi:methionine-rich copper-binding protein CopC
MKYLFVTMLLFVCSLMPTQSASAHVLVTDESRTKGAVLHIIPDDDPAAGEEATLYFDTQEQLLNSESSITLVITDSKGKEMTVETNTNDSLVTAKYVFPVQGMYLISYHVQSKGTTYVFRQSQRVARGISDGALNRPTYAWAEIMLVASGVGFGLLIVTAFNRRKSIAQRSTF